MLDFRVLLKCLVCYVSSYVKQDDENFSTSRSKRVRVVNKGSFYTINDFSGESDPFGFINKGDA